MKNVKNVVLSDGRSLKEVLELHKKWLNNEAEGVHANLRGADLRGADLRGANLIYADLTDTDLRWADLRGTNLRCANLKNSKLTGADLTGSKLTGADLTDVDLRGADLTDIDLTNANLIGADLRGADLTDIDLTGTDLRGANLANVDLRDVNLRGFNLTGADLTDVVYNEDTLFFALQCPERGSFVGYKKANNKIVELLITEDAKRSSATSRKCRCSKAKVLSITSLDGKENYDEVASNYDEDFIYKVGEIVEVKDFDEDRWNECSTGIHFFITRQEAVNYRC